MQYIIFLITIQLPFIYLFWKIFQIYQTKYNKILSNLVIQTKTTVNSVDMLRLSLEKSTENIYSRLKDIEKKQGLIESRIFQLEKYTGLRSNSSNLTDTLADKDLI